MKLRITQNLLSPPNYINTHRAIEVANKFNESNLGFAGKHYINYLTEGQGNTVKFSENLTLKFIKNFLTENKIELAGLNFTAEVSVFKFLNAMGCFSNLPILNKYNMSTGAISAQKGSHFVERLLKENVVDINYLSDNFFRLRNDFKPNQELIEFLSEKRNNEFHNFNLIKHFNNINPDFFMKFIDNFEDIKKFRNSVDLNGNPKQYSWVDAINRYLQVSEFKNVSPENEKMAKLFIEKGFNQKAFEEAVSIQERAVKTNIPKHILGKELNESKILNEIKDIQKKTEAEISISNSQLKEIINDKFTYEMLDKSAIENYIIGVYVDSCATIQSTFYGKKIAQATVLSPDVQNMVVRNSDGEIIAKGALYFDKEFGRGVFNKFELNENYKASYKGKSESNGGSKRIREKQRREIFKTFIRGIEKFIEEYDKQNPKKPVKQINVGMGIRTLSDEIRHLKIANKKQKVIVPANYGFEDVEYVQSIIYKKGQKQKGLEEIMKDGK